MNQVVFNFHDVILWVTAIQCLFFALLLLASNASRRMSTYFLAAFLLAHVFIPLNELIMWASEFRLRVREHWPELYYILGAANYVDGALLFFCIKSLIFRDFHLRRRDLLHLLPLAGFLIFMWASFYRLPFDQRLGLIDSQQFVYGAGYVYLDFSCKLLRVVYCVISLILLTKYRRLLETTHSNVKRTDVSWVTLMVMGFLITMSLEALLSASKIVFLYHRYNMDVFTILGLTGYYSSFVLVNLLVFTGMRYFSGFASVRQTDGSKKSLADNLLNPELGRDIDVAMRRDKAYMDPDLTLEHLAERLNIPARDLSKIINRHFGVNFYEFINRYRIEEARHLLTDEASKDMTITDIFMAVGFNSKSVFNTFFKKLVGKTPSQYRKEAGELEMQI